MNLKFKINKIQKWAKIYGEDYDKEMFNLQASVNKQKCLTKKQLMLVCKWKSLRSSGYCERNSDLYVKEMTHFALTTKDERARIEVLTLLDGVLWPTASVILHFFHSDNYPILDYRALWSVNAGDSFEYNFDHWMQYVTFCRNLADQASVDMRTLDKALWRFSIDNQQ